ncbi:hypothetical protein SRHO_G00019530 [Serrasalmus rhombeus]
MRIRKSDKQTATSAPGKNTPRTNTKKRPALKMGCWNVHTMTTGLEDPQNISDARKTAVIKNELQRLKVHIVILQETHLAESGTLKEKDYTFTQGKSAEDHREHRVGFAVRNTLLKMVEPHDKGSEHLLTLRLHTSEGPVTLISAYAPTLTSTPEAKDEFYTNLNDVIKNFHRSEHLVLLGNLNARVGGDHDSWVPLELARSTRMVSACWSSALIMRDQFLCECHGSTLDHNNGTSSTWSLSNVQALSTCFSPTHTTAPTMTLTTHWYAARSSCYQRNFIAPNKKGSHALTQPRCNIQGSLRHAQSFEDALTTGYTCNTASESWKYLYKNKGDRSDCNNYRGISLLSTVGKLYARVLLVHLQQLAERIYPESQRGFRAEISTGDMIFSLRQLQEKYREQQKPLYIAFLDLTKAFDLVSRDRLFNILLKIGCPQKLYSMIRSYHDSIKATIQYEGSLSEPFDIKSDVKQGCILAPTLFNIFSLLLKHPFGNSTEGVYIQTR